MKQLNHWIGLAAAVLLGLSSYSCGGFLDVDPELGITEDDVFSTYKNFTRYFDYIFSYDDRKQNIYEGYPMYVDLNQRRFTFNSTTDASDTGRWIRAQQQVKVCMLTQETTSDFTFSTSMNPICKAMFTIIRIANRSIENIDRLKNATPQQRNDLLGQAYFVRAYAHFVLCRFIGGVPYIDTSMMEDWDLPRQSAYDTYLRCVEDFDIAFDYLKAAGKVRRDPFPGVSGHLTGSDLERPNGCACKAMKARALLYAASPLNNERGVEDWKAAAAACAEALNLAVEYRYELLPLYSYTDNFYGKMSSNETIWGWSFSIKAGSSMSAMLAYPLTRASNSSGVCPTQNFVDKYETKWGDPMNTEADRAAAIAAGHYNPQDPYANLDPRFELTILHDGSETPYATTPINIYYDPATASWPATEISGKSMKFGVPWGTNTTTGGTSTGYYCRKYWRGAVSQSDAAYYRLDGLVRLAELYLEYAEAVNEAYGPTGTVAGSTLTPVDAVNIVRSRVGMPEVKSIYTSDKDTFRERIHNERNVELAYEGNHYYFDIRRWKTAPVSMSQTLYGMYVTSCPVSEEYPNGRIYERRPIPDNRQCLWKDCMYWWPFPDSYANKLVNFVNNERWQ